MRDARRPRREHEQRRDEWHDQGELARAQVERLVGDGRAACLVQHSRDRAQHVHRREHDRARADHGPPPSALVRAGQDEELTRERRGARHRE